MKNNVQKPSEQAPEMVLMTAEDQKKLANMQAAEATAAPADDVEKPAGDTEKPADSEMSLEELVSKVAVEADDKPTASFSLGRTLGGVIIARMLQKQIGLVLFISFFLIIYINNRYMCQKQTVQIDKLEKKLTAIRYKTTVCTSMLTEKSRESNILRILAQRGDSTLTIPKEPPYRIKVKKGE